MEIVACWKNGRKRWVCKYFNCLNRGLFCLNRGERGEHGKRGKCYRDSHISFRKRWVW